MSIIYITDSKSGIFFFFNDRASKGTRKTQMGQGESNCRLSKLWRKTTTGLSVGRDKESFLGENG